MRSDTSELRAREIGDQILRFIKDSRLGVGDRLPPETQMAEQLGVSRATIREVYVRLLAQGVIVRRHGFGTFVGQMPIQDDQTFQAGFAHSIKAAGLVPTVEILSVDRITVADEQAHHFGCPVGTEISRTLRLFRASGDPVVLIEDHFSPAIEVRDIDLDRYAVDMIAGMATVTDMGNTFIDTWTTALQLEEEQAGYLELPAGHPALHIYSMIHTPLRQVLSLAWAWLNPRLIEMKSRRAVNIADTSALFEVGGASPVTHRAGKTAKQTTRKGKAE